MMLSLSPVVLLLLRAAAASAAAARVAADAADAADAAVADSAAATDTSVDRASLHDVRQPTPRPSQGAYPKTQGAVHDDPPQPVVVAQNRHQKATRRAPPHGAGAEY
jgi:hypothetical protein